MLLSSMNLVAKPKSGKGRKTEKKQIIEEKPSECEMCKKEREEEKTIFKFPTRNPNGSSTSMKSSGSSSDQESIQSLQNLGDRVTIATGDDLCLSVDQFFYTIGLRDEARCDSTCVFRKRVLDSKQVGNGTVETAVFALDCDQDFYLTTNKHRELELNFFPSTPTSEIDDERTFLVHHTSLGHALIQPVHHKNTYLHHIDQALSIQQLDLNWRCPEEYFFHFNAIPEPISYERTEKLKPCTHVKCNSQKDAEVSVSSEQVQSENSDNTNSDSNKILLPTRKVCKNKHFMKQLFVGCFGGRSQLISQADA